VYDVLHNRRFQHMFVQQYVVVPFINEEKEKKILTQGKKRQTGDRE
jgi:hypothetical protein